MENVIEKCGKLKNNELQRATNAIIRAAENIGDELAFIARVMEKIRENRLYTYDFRDIYEYGKTLFGFDQSGTDNMIRTGHDCIYWLSVHASNVTTDPLSAIISNAAFRDAGIALTTIAENIDDDSRADKIKKLRDDLQEIMEGNNNEIY